MTKGRMEAFSDGVIAIIITIMVLELKVPHVIREAELADLRSLWPVFISYLLSFIYIGIYWNNHHHMLHHVKRINGRALWANLHLLFWLSLVPFATAWMGENDFASAPVTLYGLVLLGAAIAYTILTYSLVCIEGKASAFAEALGSDFKGKASLIIYIAAILASFQFRYFACSLYVLVAIIWFIPDRRFERQRGADEVS